MHAAPGHAGVARAIMPSAHRPLAVSHRGGRCAIDVFRRSQ
ncbi:hypothetical protein B551_0202925 [Cupriavidus sp. HPC(L)]|nr:hypothetical protein B551_0202925 [Cupriavidus sp. HPC(L)]